MRGCESVSGETGAQSAAATSQTSTISEHSSTVWFASFSWYSPPAKKSSEPSALGTTATIERGRRSRAVRHAGGAPGGASWAKSAKSTTSVRFACACLPPANTAMAEPFGATRPAAPITPRPAESADVDHAQLCVSSTSTTALSLPEAS